MRRRQRLVLHVGLPKTGTSALQLWCDSNRAELRRHGVNYPEADKGLSDPKHQFLVPGLRRNELGRLRDVLAGNDCDTLLLSTEGLTNHLYDFDPAGLASFRAMNSGLDVFVFLVSREREAWLRSYYKQLVVNPPLTQYDYATPLLYPEFCRLPRVRRLADIPNLERDLTSAFGACKVVTAPYEGDWMGAFIELLEVEGKVETSTLERVHASVPDDLVEIVRQVNAMLLPAEDRAEFLACLQACFQTAHQTMGNRYRLSAGPDDRRRNGLDIVARLRPETPEQSRIVATLKGWLERV